MLPVFYIYLQHTHLYHEYTLLESVVLDEASTTSTAVTQEQQMKPYWEHTHSVLSSQMSAEIAI